MSINSTRSSLHKIFRTMRDRYDVSAWWKLESKLEIVWGAILVQNTSWRNASLALEGLAEAGIKTIGQINELPAENLERVIKSSGFYRTKAITIKGFSKLVTDLYSGDLDKFLERPVAHLREELLSIKGIGEETADDIILYASHKPVFVIDKFTRRILGRYGIGLNTSKYSKWQEMFHSNLDHNASYFQDFHALLVKLGQDHCRTIPKCVRCCLKSDCKTGLKNCM